MKIFYLAFSRIPTEKAHGLQIMKTCEALADAGADVVLSVPNRKTPIREDPFSYYGVKKNFVLKKVPSIDWVGWGKLGFALSLLAFSERAHFDKRFWQADVVYSRDALVLFQYIFLGRSLVYEAHTKPTWVSTFVARRARRVVVISEGLRDAYIRKDVSSKKIIVAHDAVDLDFSHPPSQTEARERLGIALEGKVALYVGRIDAEKGVETLAAAAELLPAEYSVVIVGDGPKKSELKKKYPKATFLSQTQYTELPLVLPAGSVLVLPNSAKSIDASVYTSPLKAYAYLASGIPIVASNVPALTSVLKDSATYFEADNAASLAEALMQEHQMPTLRPYTWKERGETILQNI